MISVKNNIQKKYLNKKIIKILSIRFNKIYNNLSSDLEISNSSLNILSKNYKLNFKNKDLKRFKKYKTIAIIGMGGSILGSEAIYYFLKNKVKKNVYFFNDLDDEKLRKFEKNENPKNVLFLVVSKSGNTLETISNLLSLNFIKKDSNNIIIITEKRNSFLYSLCESLNLYYIQHKNFIGGRFSVLSEVGIIPAYFFGINFNLLRTNLKKYLKGRNKQFLKESSVKLACLLKQKKINNLIFLNYCSKLEKFLYWGQQLVAESLGKKGNGFLPIVSNMPKDHHSLLQLYLDGPRDKLFHIFSEDDKSKKKIKASKFSKKISYLNNKTIDKVKTAQKNALARTFTSNKIPFREFKIKEIDEKTLGELFSYFILETVIIGKLLNINPFNQPAVEQVKLFTKKFLK